jgi:hypothetical protein
MRHHDELAEGCLQEVCTTFMAVAIGAHRRSVPTMACGALCSC